MRVFLSNPSAMTIPALLFALDLLLLRRSIRTVLRGLLPWFALSAGCMVIAWLAQPAMRATPGPLWARPLRVGDAVTFYLWKLLVPVQLAVCYGRSPQEVMAHGWFYVAWVVPLVLAAVLWWKRSALPVLVAAALVFVVAAPPALGLVRVCF